MGAANCNQMCEGQLAQSKYITSEGPYDIPTISPLYQSGSHRPIGKQIQELPKLSEVAKSIIKSVNISKLKSDGLTGIELPPFEIAQSQLVYAGQWLNGSPHGKGAVYKEDGGFFKGQFKEGQANCIDGLYIYSDGSYYRGGVKSSKAHGKGTLVYKDSVMTYTGEWQNDKPHGFGKQVYKDGTLYQGHFKNGLKNGRGKFSWTNGCVYQGNFHEGSMHGEGVLTNKNGSIYRGTFVNNKKEGQGKQNSIKGEYTGQFKNGRKEGRGQLKYTNGAKYVGGFQNGQPHGQGILTLRNNQQISGVWNEGQNVIIHQFRSRILKHQNTIINEIESNDY